MTVSTLINRVAYTATAAQTDFSYPFKIFTGEESTLLVYLNTVLKALTTDYTVTGAGVGAGGNVVFNSGLTAGDKVVIVRSLALSQLVDYVANDPFPAETHEEALDRLTMLVQQLEEANNRAITLIVTSALSDITFPDPGGGEYIKWNAGGTALETGSFTGSGTEVSSFMATVLDDLTAAAARTTLGAGTSSYSDPLTTRGDSLVRDSANATARLPVGGANTFLGSDGTDLAHRAIATADIAAGVITLAKLPTGGKLEPQTGIATTSGTEWDYTGISADVRKITMVFSGFSTSGTSKVIIQLGGSGGFENTGYTGAASDIAGTVATGNINSGFRPIQNWDAARTLYGRITLVSANGITWTFASSVGLGNTSTSGVGGGIKTLSGALTQVRLTTEGGSDTGDAGGINIILE